jgi:pimeloyl-ACP methyl ester carboxylesterase
LGIHGSAWAPQLNGLPTFVVSAAQDRVALPAVGRALAAAIPGARFIEMPYAAHSMSIQQAECINTLPREHFG